MFQSAAHDQDVGALSDAAFAVQMSRHTAGSPHQDDDERAIQREVAYRLNDLDWIEDAVCDAVEDCDVRYLIANIILAYRRGETATAAKLFRCLDLKIEDTLEANVRSDRKCWGRSS